MLEEELCQEDLIFRIADSCKAGRLSLQNDDYESVREIADQVYSLLLEYSIKISKEITNTADASLIPGLKKKYRYISGLAKKMSNVQQKYGITNAPSE